MVARQKPIKWHIIITVTVLLVSCTMNAAISKLKCNPPLSESNGHLISYNGNAERVNVTIFGQTGHQDQLLLTSVDLHMAVCTPDDRYADHDFSSSM